MGRSFTPMEGSSRNAPIVVPHLLKSSLVAQIDSALAQVKRLCHEGFIVGRRNFRNSGFDLPEAGVSRKGA